MVAWRNIINRIYPRTAETVVYGEPWSTTALSRTHDSDEIMTKFKQEKLKKQE